MVSFALRFSSLVAVVLCLSQALIAQTFERQPASLDACSAALVGIDISVEPEPPALGLVRRSLHSIRAGLSEQRQRIIADRYYFLIEMLYGYQGESTRDSVVYYSPALRREHQIAVRQGKLVVGHGDTVKLDGEYIFVMDREGTLYVDRAEIGVIHHSSLSAGRAVAAAGHLWAVDGTIVMMTNKSGHYAPPAWVTRQALDRLRQLGADLSVAKYEEYVDGE